MLLSEGLPKGSFFGKLKSMKRAHIFTLGILLLILALGAGVFMLKNFFQPLAVSIAIITDIDHCPSRVPASQEFLEQFLAESVSRNMDAQVSLGDNTSHRLSNCSETADADARFIAEKIRSNGVPSYFVLGDHDIASSVESYRAWQETAHTEKTYYSFDIKDVHVVVLDTVLGGDPLSPPCEEVEACQRAREELGRMADTKGSAEYKKAKDALTYEEDRIKETRSSGVRDVGRFGEEQIRWLEEDLKNTRQSKVLVLSDHPIFPFVSERKSYNTVNANRIRDLIRNSNKEAVFISGEAHVWHEEVFEGQQFYIVDEFKKANGSWALFYWDKNGFRLERRTH